MIKKYNQFIKEDIGDTLPQHRILNLQELESDVRHIFDDFLEEYDLKNLEFQVKEVTVLGDVLMRVLDGEEIEFDNSELSSGGCFEVIIGVTDNHPDPHHTEMPDVLRGVSYDYMEVEFKKMLEDSDMIEAIEDRMLDIGYKLLGKYVYLDVKMFGTSPGLNMFFDFKKVN